MRANFTLLSLVLLATVVASTGACKRKAPNDHTEAGTAELRSADVKSEPQVVGNEPNTYLATVRREQLALRARLQERIDAVDSQLAALRVDAHARDAREGGRLVDPRSKNAAQIRSLLDRRTQLEVDLATVDRADERGWDEIKGAVERDLAAETAGHRI